MWHVISHEIITSKQRLLEMHRLDFDLDIFGFRYIYIYIFIYIYYIYIYIILYILYICYIHIIHISSLSTAVFSHRYSFFTVCLVHYLHTVPPWGTPKGKFLKSRFPDRWKMHFRHSLSLLLTPSFWHPFFSIHSFSLFLSDFSWSFRLLWGVSEKRWLERYIQLCFMRFCKYLNQRKSENMWIE